MVVTPIAAVAGCFSCASHQDVLPIEASSKASLGELLKIGNAAKLISDQRDDHVEDGVDEKEYPCSENQDREISDGSKESVSSDSCRIGAAYSEEFIEAAFETVLDESCLEPTYSKIGSESHPSNEETNNFIDNECIDEASTEVNVSGSAQITEMVSNIQDEGKSVEEMNVDQSVENEANETPSIDGVESQDFIEAGFETVLRESCLRNYSEKDEQEKDEDKSTEASTEERKNYQKYDSVAVEKLAVSEDVKSQDPRASDVTAKEEIMKVDFPAEEFEVALTEETHSSLEGHSSQEDHSFKKKKLQKLLSRKQTIMK